MIGFPVVHIYTDGSYRPTKCNGSWAYSIYPGGNIGYHCGSLGSPDTASSNRMELNAVVCALEAIIQPCVIYLFSDSMYVLSGINTIYKRRARGWMSGHKKHPRKNSNIDLWERLYAVLKRHIVYGYHVYGHTGVVGNEIVDALAANMYSYDPNDALIYSTDPDTGEVVTNDPPRHQYIAYEEDDDDLPPWLQDASIDNHWI